jgi:hypothetical protein
MICYDEKNIVRSMDDLSKMFDIDEKTLTKLSKDFEIIWQEIKYSKETDTNDLKNESINLYNNSNSNTSNFNSNTNTNNDNNLYTVSENNTEVSSNLETPTQHVDVKTQKQITSEKRRKKHIDILNDHINTLTHYLRKLNIGSNQHQYFIELYTKIYNDRVLLEHIPRSKCSVIIYQGCLDRNININTANIIRICQTSDVTFNKCYKKFKAIYLEN